MKIICVGLNYQAHIDEMQRAFAASEQPTLFMKPETALLTTDKAKFYIPDFTSEVHYEAEIVVRIEKMGKNIAERFAHRYYNQITLGLDLTARDLQAELKRKGMPWEISKAFDNSAVVGEFFSKEEFDLNNLNFSLDKNGTIVQQGSSANMIHSIDQIVAYASQFFTLKTGDLIFTGTPSGVGRVDIGDQLTGYIEDRKTLSLEIC